jgi:Saccharopine dehydrogenase NADP binding domain
MVRVARVLIVGGYGVFGRLLAVELLQTTDAQIVVAGRDAAKARRACRDLSRSPQGRLESMTIDLARSGELRRAAEDFDVVACTAGPFQALSPRIVDEAVEAGAHWIDVAEVSVWVLGVLEDRELDEQARTADVAIGTGLSTLPALSGVLARVLTERVPQASTATVVLSIGNRNRKGSATIASALMNDMRERSTVHTPLGPRLAYRIDSPDARLFEREHLDTTCWVALESAIARRVAVLAAGRSASRDPGEVMGRARFLSRVASVWNSGASGGSVQVELRDERGSGAAATFVGSDQRIAILPAAIVVQRLVEGTVSLRGVIRPADWMPIPDWIAELRARGVGAQWTQIGADSQLWG